MQIQLARLREDRHETKRMQLHQHRAVECRRRGAATGQDGRRWLSCTDVRLESASSKPPRHTTPPRSTPADVIPLSPFSNPSTCVVDDVDTWRIGGFCFHGDQFMI